MATRSTGAGATLTGWGEPRRRRDDGPPVITARGVNKTFRIPRHRPTTLKERVLHPFRVIPKIEFDAAQDVSFTVNEGEFFGVAGRNGSGKSTLLKMIAGIYTPDSGTIDVRGRISPFIELGVGFNPELTARDNVLINATMLGVSRSEINRRYPKILAFAELEEFEDLKLKNYSSGMLVRLAFSTAIQVDADVLLLDEVLAVGDAGFQEKCFNEFRRMKQQGKTIVFVTHAMEALRRFCDRAILLEKGEVVAEGDPEVVATHYRELAADEGASVGDFTTDAERFGDRTAEALDVWVEDSRGRRRDVLEQGERITFCAEFEMKQDFRSPVFGIQVKGESGADAFAMNTLWAEVDTPDYRSGERATLRITIENHLGVGAYSLTPGVANRDGLRIADIRFGMRSFRVDGPRWTGAMADLPFELEVEDGRR